MSGSTSSGQIKPVFPSYLGEGTSVAKPQIGVPIAMSGPSEKEL
jgi:hypothetical protein